MARKTEEKGWIRKVKTLDWSQFVEYATGWDPKKGSHFGESSYAARNQRADRSWDLGAGFAGAVSMARKGWPEGVRGVRALSSRLTTRLMGAVPTATLVPDVVGSCPDVGLFMAGDPECMLRVEEVPTARPIARIVVNVTASCGVDARVLFKRGSAVAALVHCLETAGTRAQVEVVICNEAEYGAPKERREIRIIAKKSDQQLDLDMLAYATAHPGAYRRLGFSCWERWSLEDVTPAYTSAMHNGYGYCGEASEGHESRGDIYLSKADLREATWDSEDGAAAWVAEQLRGQGIELLGGC